MGIKGTGAGKEVGGGPAASRVRGDILKNIGGDDYIKWCRVHIKENGSYRNILENPEGSEGFHGRSLRKWNRSGTRREVSCYGNGISPFRLLWARVQPYSRDMYSICR